MLGEGLSRGSLAREKRHISRTERADGRWQVAKLVESKEILLPVCNKLKGALTGSGRRRSRRWKEYKQRFPSLVSLVMTV